MEKHSEHAQYVMGFILALLLTAIPFWVVWTEALAGMRAAAVIGVCAFVQVVVHAHFFLHISTSKQKREDLELILFATLIMVILIGGTIWILSNLHHRMH